MEVHPNEQDHCARTQTHTSCQLYHKILSSGRFHQKPYNLWTHPDAMSLHSYEVCHHLQSWRNCKSTHTHTHTCMLERRKQSRTRRNNYCRDISLSLSLHTFSLFHSWHRNKYTNIPIHCPLKSHLSSHVNNHLVSSHVVSHISKYSGFPHVII